MQQISKQPAFELGQIVATPGALAALKTAEQQPGEFLTRHVQPRVDRLAQTRTAEKTNTALSRRSGS